MNKRYIAIRNQADSNTLELYFLDVIAEKYDWWTDSVISPVQEVIDKVNAYRPTHIKCIIDSIGGNAQAGLSIYNFLKNCSASVETEIIGLAGSIASVVAMAADAGKLRMARNAFVMIHKAEGAVGGTAEELRQAADTVDKYDDQIADIYAQRTGKAVEDIKGLYANGDYWMTATEAVAQGFADELIDNVATIEVAARLKDVPYKNLPEAIKNQLQPKAEDNDIKTFFTTQMTEMKNFFTEIVNAIKGVKPADNVSITNQIAEAVAVPFEKLGDEIENTINNKVDNVVNTDAFKTAVTNAVTEATKEITNKVTALETANTQLEQKNKDLETEITNMKGNATGGGSADVKEPKVRGSWS